MEPRPRRAVPGLGPARPRLRRHARRHPGRAARGRRRSVRRGRAARAGSPSSASPTSASPRCSTSWPARTASSSTTSPARPSTRSTSWSSWAAATWRFIDTAGIRKRVKEASGHEYYAIAAHQSTAIDRAEVAVLVLDASAADLRAGPADHPDRARGRPRAGHRLQQVGPRRRGAPLLPRPRDRARARAGAVGAADQHHRHAPAGTSTGWCRRSTRRWRAGRPGSRPARSTPSSAAWSPSTRTRCAAASSPRSCSAPRPSTAPPTFVLFTSGKLEASLRALHRAPAARGVRLRRHADRHQPASAGEAQAVVSGDAHPPHPACAVCRARRCRRAGCRWFRDGLRPSVNRRRRAACPTFPADNWWHADVSNLPVHDRSADWLSHMSTDVDLHPDFGPSYGDGPNYGIPVTVVGGDHAKVRVRFDYASESDKVSYPLGPTPGSRAAANSGGDMHAIVVDKGTLQALRDLEHPRPRRPLARRLRRGLVAEQQHAAPGRLDLRRRRRAADPAGLLRWNEVKRRHRSTTPSGSPPTSPAATTCGRPGTTPARRSACAYPPMGARFRLRRRFPTERARRRTRARSSRR